MSRLCYATVSLSVSQTDWYVCRYSALQTCCISLWKYVARCATTWIYTASKWDRWVSRHIRLLRRLSIIPFHVTVLWLVAPWMRCCVVIVRWQRTAATVAAAARAVHVMSSTRIMLPPALKCHTRVLWDTLNSSRHVFYSVCLYSMFQLLCLSSPRLSRWRKCLSADCVVCCIVADQVVVLWCFILGFLFGSLCFIETCRDTRHIYLYYY